MVKGRVRVKPGKSKRWRKGQSGATNPVTKRHREAAKGRLGNHLVKGGKERPGSVKLTADVLASHNSRELDKLGSLSLDSTSNGHLSEAGDDSLSMANSSVYSLIETAHPVFGKVKRLWNSPDESHKEICAVLAAVTEVVKEKSESHTETEYFGALLTALEAADQESSLTAIAFLLSVVMEKVPPAVLESWFSQVSRVLMEHLTCYETSGSTALLKSLLSCVTVLLSVQPSSVWSESYVKTMLQTVMNFSIHPKPRLRKSAQSGIVSMLRGGGGPEINNFHPSCLLVFKQCQRIIETEANNTVRLHVLGFLKDCFGNFHTKQIKSLCESVLKLLTLGTTVMRMTGFHCLNGLFTSVAGPQGMTADLNGQMISALYRHQPSVDDSQLLMAWSTVMESALLSLERLDCSLCIGHLPNFFTVLMKCLLAKKRDSVGLAAKIMDNILKTCVCPVISELSEEGSTKKKKGSSDNYSIVQSVFRYYSGHIHVTCSMFWVIYLYMYV